jgi:RluA family pseudouridine synthase
MTEAPLDVLYDEGPCLVINKPAGISTQAPAGIDTLEVRVKEFYRQREEKTGNIYLGVPHRLDRPVSGAIVFARHVRAARRLSKQFESRQVRKIYWACVEGRVEPESGCWRDCMRKIPGQAQGEIVDATHPEARSAVLHYRTLGMTRWGSWLEIELETGRMHQVRLQAATRGCPVVGDAQYGASITFGTQFEDPRMRAIALHARSLEFQHPMTREPVIVTAPVSEAWLAARIEGR